MESHPSHEALASILNKYPHTSGSLFQAYNDIVYAQQWKNVELVELGPCQRAAVKGQKPKTETYLYVVPCTLSETLSVAWLHDAFKLLSNPSEIYLAITSEDSSIVYYKISQGIVKPPV